MDWFFSCIELHPDNHYTLKLFRLLHHYKSDKRRAQFYLKWAAINEKGHNSLKKSSIFILLRTLIALIIALRLSFVTFAVNYGISLNNFLVKKRSFQNSGSSF